MRLAVRTDSPRPRPRPLPLTRHGCIGHVAFSSTSAMFGTAAFAVWTGYLRFTQGQRFYWEISVTILSSATLTPQKTPERSY